MHLIVDSKVEIYTVYAIGARSDHLDKQTYGAIDTTSRDVQRRRIRVRKHVIEVKPSCLYQVRVPGSGDVTFRAPNREGMFLSHQVDPIIIVSYLIEDANILFLTSHVQSTTLLLCI